VQIEFLFVHWFRHDLKWQGGPGSCRLDHLSWVLGHSTSAFGFLDPAHIVQACHLILTFAWGLTTCLLGPSQMRDLPSGDWASYYVSRSVLTISKACVMLS
jgi:hypothetical protein